MPNVDTLVTDRDGVSTRSDAQGQTTTGRFGSLVAGLPALLTDGAVYAFALWTVLYHAAFLVHLRPSVTFLVWLVCCVLLGAYLVVRRWRRRPTPTSGDDRDERTGSRAATMDRRWLLPTVAAAALAAVTAGLDGISWWVPALAGLAAAVGAVLLTRRAWLALPGTGSDTPVEKPWQSVYALVASGLVGVASLFIARNTPDDVFYVGKSVWIAERDIVPLRDFLFTEQVAPPLSSQPPIASIEVLAGALGRVFGIHAASATWYVLLPVLAVLAALSLWRLIQRWAPRRPVLAFTVALAFLAFVCGDDAALGTFHLPRLHEGKGMFVSAVVPLLWVYLTRWFDTRSRKDLAAIVAISIVATGLTSTSVMILPLVVGAAGLGMLLVGRWRDALVAGVAVMFYPVASVIVTRITLGPMTSVIASAQFFDAEGTYRRTLLVGVLGVICGLALWCGPFLVRRGTPALFAAGAAAAMSLLLVPGVLEALSAGSGLAAVLWRVPWFVPLPALVGLLCTIDVPPLARVATLRAVVGGVLAAVLVGAFAVAGTPMWSARSFVEVHERPTWKLPQQRQKIDFWIWNLDDRPPGLLLAPSTLMRTMPIVTSEVRVVMARNGYLVDYDMNSQFSQDRLKLAAFADGVDEIAPVAELAAAMDRLDVGTVCVYNGNRKARDLAPELGLVKFASRKAPGAVTCYRRTA
ncbi:DUF6077 domain-containing protein [Micromonospora avicenniae]|uniref:4-amino-4-deoxy-L-arabinose transferase n=1 Tax=Micromonospora avicenniae TaxID=1198245 RepID=A0A1N6WZE3_9ACTN|nr:DUF6077 domain-containing protein [Micromonospora avicenniae]SIQ95423.1 hypothetical protein SAMN05444858_105165 [Micromonospora avicenniae]